MQKHTTLLYLQFHIPTATQPLPATLDIDNEDALVRQNASNTGVESRGSRGGAERGREVRGGGFIRFLLPLLGGRGGHGSFHLVLALATTFVTAQVSDHLP